MSPPFGILGLSLVDFRGYTSLKLALDPRPVVLYGPNGAGKTNILEALSLLSPGRGLRRARLSEMHRLYASTPGWWIGVDVACSTGIVSLSTGVDLLEGKERRQHAIYGKSTRSLSAFSDYITVTWLTPQMDRLFTEGPGGRRRFLDRLVLGLQPHHGDTAANYELALKERWQALQLPSWDNTWLSVIEQRLAHFGVLMSAARHQLCERLNRQMYERTTTFPRANLKVEGEIDTWVVEKTAEEALHLFKEALKRSRSLDAHTGGASHGPHKSNLLVYNEDKNLPAEVCSTGEQKALLLSIMLAFGELMNDYSLGVPIILLDEAVAHLDPRRREDLFDEMCRLNLQVWMTGTESEMFTGLGERAQFFQVDNSVLTSHKGQRQGMLL